MIADGAGSARGTGRCLFPLLQAMFISGIIVISIGPLLPSIMSDLGIGLSHAGFIPMGFFLGRGLGGLALMSALASVSIPRMIRSAYASLGVTLIAVGLASVGMWSFFALYALVGFGAAILLTTPGLWVTSQVRMDTSRALSLVVAPYALATVVTPWAIGLLLDVGVSWRCVLVGEGVLSLLCSVVSNTRLLPDVPNRQNVRLGQLRQVYRFQPRLLIAILALGFAYVGLESSFGVWLPKFHASVFGVGMTGAAATVTIFWAGQLVGRLASGRLLHGLVSRSALIMALACLTALFSLAMAFAPTYWASVPVVFAAGLASAALWPLLTGYCARFPAWHAGIVYTLTGLVGAVSSVVFPYAIAPAASSFGLRLAFALLAIPAAAVALLSALLRRAAADGPASSASLP